MKPEERADATNAGPQLSTHDHDRSLPLRFSRGRNVNDAQPRQHEAADFEAFVRRLERDRAPSKKGAAYFCGPLNGEGRCAEGVLPRRWIALDLDGIRPDVHEDLRLWLAGSFRGVAWPTHSSTREEPRERVVVVLDREATRDECVAVGRVLAADIREQFGDAVKFDPATLRGEQPLFLAPLGVKFARFDGAPLDVDQYLAAAAHLPPAPTAAPAEEGDGKVRTGRNDFLSREAFRLRKHGQTVEQIESVLLAMNAATCEPPLDEAEVLAIVYGKRNVPANAEIPHTTEPDAAADSEAFRIIDLSALRRPIEPVRWAWDRRIPRKEVTLLSGHGGAGKSMLALMLALHAWSGTPAWGAATECSRVAFYSAEDDESTVLRRVKFICSMLGLPEPEPDSGFSVLDANASPELYIPARSGLPGGTTFAYERLREFMATNRVELLVVDGASDTFTGDEIRRAEVRAFVRALARLAREFNAAIVLLAHVDKATSRGTADGTDSYSGSTAWHNSVRSRLYLSQPGAGRLVLEHQKSNHGPLAPALAFDWPEGDVPRPALAVDPARDDEWLSVLLLDLIGEATAHRNWIHTAPTSTRNAHRMFKDDERLPDTVKGKDVFRVLDAAEKAGHLVRVPYLTDDRKKHERWGFPGV